MYVGGMLCESNKRDVLRSIVEAESLVEEMGKAGEDTASQLDDNLSLNEQFQLGRKPGRRNNAAKQNSQKKKEWENKCEMFQC